VKLPAGQIVRFKGRHAATNAGLFADELHGRCKRTGNEIEITNPTTLRPIVPPRDETERLSKGDIMEFQSGGRTSASRPFPPE
jgi:hypothetical protein